MKVHLSVYDSVTKKGHSSIMKFEHLPRVGEYIVWRNVMARVREITHDIDSKVIKILAN
jgi:sorbitol-specific phosphotransferase system component IIC